jgi:hypothetical protein
MIGVVLTIPRDKVEGWSSEIRRGISGMGLTLGLHAISAKSYAAALNDNPKDFKVETAVESLDLDKAWHAIHFLITGDDSLTFLLSGKQIKGVSEHCEVHAPESVCALHNAMQSTSVAEITQGFKPESFSNEKICPEGLSADQAASVAQHLERFLTKLGELADQNLGMLIVIR